MEPTEVEASPSVINSQENKNDATNNSKSAESLVLTPEYAASPNSLEEMHEQLDLILGACGQLQKLMRSKLPITIRELSKLRKAFWLATGETDKLKLRSYSVASSDDSRGGTNITSTDTEDYINSRPSWISTPVPRRGRRNNNNNELERINASAVLRAKKENKEEEEGMVKRQNSSSSTTSSLTDYMQRQDSKVMACDRALRQLEEYVITRPEAHTFDMGNIRSKNKKSNNLDADDKSENNSDNNNDDDDDDNNNDDNKSIGWHFFKIPFERRMQTLVVSTFLFFTFIPISLVLTLMLLLNKWTMPFMLIYLIYIYTFGRPKHPLKKNLRFTRLRIWRYYSDYFPVRLVIPRYVRRQFDSNKNYFFIYHPHGIHGFGAIAKFSLDADVDTLLPGLHIHAQTLKLNFFVPFWRELTILCGSGDASSDCIHRTLRAGPGESVLLVVGGARESLLAKPNTNELTLQKRKGFVRIALQEGSPLVPVYAFGENDVYRIPRMAHSDWWKKLEKFLRKVTTFAIPLFVGRGWFNYCFGVLPHRRPIVVVVGEPMPVPKIVNPTPQEIQEWHDKYVLALQKLFNEHRGVYDVESSGLRIY